MSEDTPHVPGWSQGEGDATHVQGNRKHGGWEVRRAGTDAGRDSTRGRPADAGRGDGGGSGFLRRGPSARAGRRGQSAGGEKRQGPAAEDHPGCGHRGDSRPAGQRPARGCVGPQAAFYEPDSSALHAALAQGVRGVAGALPAGSLHGRFPRSVARSVRRRCVGPVAFDDHAADGRLGAGACGISKARPERARLRLRLGGRGPLPYPFGRGSPVHPCHDWGSSRRDQGAPRC